jgi:HNH endonuclease
VRPEDGVLARIYANATIAPNGCWVWHGCIARGGYGHIKGVGGRQAKLVYVHKFVYEQLVGEVPQGLVLDHLVCDNPPCFNPYHLNPCPQRINVLRGGSPTARNAAKTQCDSGHALTEGNIYRQPTRPAHRYCRECRRRYSREQELRRQAANAR